MHIDFLGPLTQTLNGNSYVGLAVCALTKYVEAAGKIANTKLTFFKHQNTLEIQTYYNRGGGGLSILFHFSKLAKRGGGGYPQALPEVVTLRGC